MYLDTATETKRTIKTGGGIPFEKFTAHEQSKIKKAIFDFWGLQSKSITGRRVAQAIATLSLPVDILDDIDQNLDSFVNSKLKPLLVNSVNFAGNGSQKIAGMMDDINSAVGADILFNLNSETLLQFIQDEGVTLITSMGNSQIESIRSILSESIQNDWSLGRTVKTMKQGITLTPKDSKSVMNTYDRTFQSELKRFTADPKIKDPVTRARANAERAAAKQHRKLQNARANRITNTELKGAHEFANQEAHQQAINGGIIKTALKTWRRNNFTDNWATSVLYDGKTIGIDESFFQFGIPVKTTMSNGKTPGEINELCSLEWKVIK